MDIESGEGENKKNAEWKAPKKEKEKVKLEKVSENNKVLEGAENSSEEYVFPDKATIPELTKLCSDPEAVETVDHWLKIIEEEEKAKFSKEKKEYDLKIEELEKMLASFEAEYPLIDLLLIVDVNVAMNSPLRKSAKEALGFISDKLTVLRKENKISLEKYNELEKKYKLFNNAVGHLSGGKIDHDR